MVLLRVITVDSGVADAEDSPPTCVSIFQRVTRLARPREAEHRGSTVGSLAMFEGW